MNRNSDLQHLKVFSLLCYLLLTRHQAKKNKKKSLNFSKSIVGVKHLNIQHKIVVFILIRFNSSSFELFSSKHNPTQKKNTVMFQIHFFFFFTIKKELNQFNMMLLFVGYYFELIIRKFTKISERLGLGGRFWNYRDYSLIKPIIK